MKSLLRRNQNVHAAPFTESPLQRFTGASYSSLQDGSSPERRTCYPARPGPGGKPPPSHCDTDLETFPATPGTSPHPLSEGNPPPRLHSTSCPSERRRMGGFVSERSAANCL